MVDIVKVHPEDWKSLSRNAHLASFAESYDGEDFERISFAVLMMRKGTQEIVGWATCREHDRDTLYLKTGGALRGAKTTSLSYSGYKQFIDWTSAKYKRVVTLIENKNSDMLRMALKAGFLVIGVRVFQNRIYLECLIEK